jgi:hypothetical protein
MLSKQALEEYKEIHKQETHAILPDEVLLDEAISLLTLFDRVYRPIKKVWLKEYESRTRVAAGLANRKTKVIGQSGSQPKPEKCSLTATD